MTWQLRTTGDVWRFTGAIAGMALAGSAGLRYLMLPPDLMARTLLPGAAMALMIALPIAWMVGRRMQADHLLRRRLEQAVSFDLLTGVHTRGSFYERTERMADRARAVIVTDIDNFKGFNDRYGHSAGDAALRQFACILTRNCRNADIVARFGGEEFVIVLRDITAEKGLVAAERLAARVRTTPILFAHHRLRLTASFGVAFLPPGGDMDSAIQQADRALYRAKHAGRDRAFAFDPARDHAAIPMSTAAE